LSNAFITSSFGKHSSFDTGLLCQLYSIKKEKKNKRKSKKKERKEEKNL